MNATVTYRLNTLHLAAIVRTSVCADARGNLACVHLTVDASGGSMEATDASVAYRERFNMNQGGLGHVDLDVCISLNGVKDLKAWLKNLPKARDGHLVRVTYAARSTSLNLTLDRADATDDSSCSIGLMDSNYPSAGLAAAMEARASLTGIAEAGINTAYMARVYNAMDCENVRMTWTGRVFVFTPIVDGTDKRALVMPIALDKRD